MAIKTGDIFKTLTFDGESSGDYGVYITGEAVYNAPERAVEMVEIPNRNGAYALDKGYFENIEVTYPAGLFGVDESDFASAVSDFRNFLCSKTGYCRLEDEYNTGEYREAIYKSGLEVSPASLRAGEFNITFDCKPQRFLTSGEAAMSITSGATVTNPTLFDAKPQLEVNGYGNILINDAQITIGNKPIGKIRIVSVGEAETQRINYTLNTTRLNNGDDIVLDEIKFSAEFSGTPAFEVDTIDGTSDSSFQIFNPQPITASGNIFGFHKATFHKGTAATKIGKFTRQLTLSSTQTQTVNCQLVYDGNNTLTAEVTSPTPALTSPWQDGIPRVVEYDLMGVYGISTKTASNYYIDLDIGEAYITNGGGISSVNSNVVLPAELPTLKSGNNTITFDNTITQLKIVPRYWKV